MEKEDLKVLNKGEEEEMVRLFVIIYFHFTCASVKICFSSLPPIRLHHLLSCHFLGAAGLPSVSLAAGSGGPRGALHRRLPPPAALLDARVVRQIYLHSYHSP